MELLFLRHKPAWPVTALFSVCLSRPTLSFHLGLGRLLSSGLHRYFKMVKQDGSPKNPDGGPIDKAECKEKSSRRFSPGQRKGETRAAWALFGERITEVFLFTYLYVFAPVIKTFLSTS